MKLITWNCNMAFRKKAEYILAHDPDILVVPECEHPDKLQFTSHAGIPKDIIWYGTNRNKGLAVFSYGDYRLKLLDCHNPQIKNVLPISVNSPALDFTLFAVWANNPADKDGSYITQVWKALHCYEHMVGSRTIWVGDFNSNKLWDREYPTGNHSQVVSKLEAKQIFSTYHQFYSLEHGKEAYPTLYMYRHSDKPYHVDYCFASVDFLQKLQDVEVGRHSDWKAYSDHKPLLVTFDITGGD